MYCTVGTCFHEHDCLPAAVLLGTKAAVFPTSDGKEARRTHRGMLNAMAKSETCRRYGNSTGVTEIAFATGIKGACAWSQLSYVRFPWFRTIDWMHLIAGLIGRHICAMLSGSRNPTPLTDPRREPGWSEDPPAGATPAAIRRFVEAQQKKVETYEAACESRKVMLQVLKDWRFPSSVRRGIDRTYQATRGASSLTRAGGGPMEGRPKMKMHNWLRYLDEFLPVQLYPGQHTVTCYIVIH
jgi:hypothetical protein